MRHLFERMYPGIGTPSANQLDWMIGDKAECCLQMLLYRLAMGLALPATISRSRILDTQRVLHDPFPENIVKPKY